MSNKFLRAVLALYPRRFRRRYGPEVQGLVNDLEAAGDRSRLRLVSGLLGSAVVERLRTVRLDARLTIPALVAMAVMGTIVGLNWSHVGQRFQRPNARDGTYLLASANSSTHSGLGAPVAAVPAVPPATGIARSTAPPTPGTSVAAVPAVPPATGVARSTALPTPGTGVARSTAPPTPGTSVAAVPAVPPATGGP